MPQVTTETLIPNLPPIPATPANPSFDGAVLVRCGNADGTAWNHVQFPVNPDIEQQYDCRVTLVQTDGGAYFDDYGFGITKLTLTSNTAWTSPKGLYNGFPANGYKIAKHLYADIMHYYFDLEHSNSNPQNVVMEIFDYTVGQAWQVKPIPPFFTLSRSKSEPMVYQYTFHCVVIKDLTNDPSSPNVDLTDPVQSYIVTTAPHDSYSSPAQQTSTSAQGVSQAVQQTYVVQSGDTLWSIAQSFYGDGNLYTLIADANSSTVPNPNLIYPGQTLIIPLQQGANQNTN